MKSRHVKPTLALVLALGVSFVVAVGLAAAAVHVLDWRVIGSGDVDGTCPAGTGALFKDCTLTSTGSASESPHVLGTHIGNSSYSFGVETGMHSLDTSSAATTPPGPGLCFAASGTGQVIAANGDVINYNTVGLLCEEAASGSDLQYNGTYHITGGTARFAAVVGGGSLTATFTRGTTGPLAVVGVAFIKIDGVINF